VKNFLFDEGIAFVTAVFDKDSYNIGEIVNVDCFVNNKRC
jgi:hypothetical protein